MARANERRAPGYRGREQFFSSLQPDAFGFQPGFAQISSIHANPECVFGLDGITTAKIPVGT